MAVLFPDEDKELLYVIWTTIGRLGEGSWADCEELYNNTAKIRRTHDSLTTTYRRINNKAEMESRTNTAQWDEVREKVGQWLRSKNKSVVSDLSVCNSQSTSREVASPAPIPMPSLPLTKWELDAQTNNAADTAFFSEQWGPWLEEPAGMSADPLAFTTTDAFERAAADEVDSAAMGAMNSAAIYGFYSITMRGLDSTITPAYDSTTTPVFDSTTTPAFNNATIPAFNSTMIPAFNSAMMPAFNSAAAMPQFDCAAVHGLDCAAMNTMNNTSSGVFQCTLMCMSDSSAMGFLDGPSLDVFDNAATGSFGFGTPEGWGGSGSQDSLYMSDTDAEWMAIMNAVTWDNVHGIDVSAGGSLAL